MNATNSNVGICDSTFCPSGCAPCDESDECHKYFFLLLFEFLFFSHRKYQETLCTMRSGSLFKQEAPGLDWCLDKCATMEGATYATWNDYDHLCQ